MDGPKKPLPPSTEFMLREFWLDWDWRQEKLTGVPKHFLSVGLFCIPMFKALPQPKDKK